jgi:hypothetical protein
LFLFKFATKHTEAFIKLCNKKLDMRDLGLAGLCALLCSLQLALHLTPKKENLVIDIKTFDKAN